MLTITKTEAKTAEWPDLPYKGLSYYEPGDAPLFAGRECDVVECAELLACADTRILILHGSTGCGKSSFLRAGLIPFLENDELGFGFLKAESGGKLKSIFVRSTGKPLVELARKVCDFAREDVTFKRSNGKDYSLNLPEIVAEFGDDEFVERVSHDPKLLIEVLGKIAQRLPKTLVLIVDQGEEVLTLRPKKDDDSAARNFFAFLDLFSQTQFDLKLLVALRTEFYGRFCAKMRQGQPNSPHVIHYLLDDLTKEQVVLAIQRPTSEASIGEYSVPYLHYRFKYEEGLPELIANELISKQLQGGLLPVMQVVCDTLYQSTKLQPASPDDPTTEAPEDAPTWVISKLAYHALGSIEDQVEKNLDAAFSQLCRDKGITSGGDIIRETDRWKDVLSALAGSQSDGTVTTEVKTADELKQLAAEATCKLDFAETMRYLVSDKVRILRYTEFVEDNNAQTVRYSLGHDATGLALFRWKVARKEVAEATTSLRKTLRVMGFVMIGLGILLGGGIALVERDWFKIFVVGGMVSLCGAMFILLSVRSSTVSSPRTGSVSRRKNPGFPP